MTRLLQGYVLQAIGHLSDEGLELLVQVGSRLSSASSWETFVEEQMEFPPNMPELIRDNWEHNRLVAQRNGQVLRAEDFAVRFTEANFLPESD